MDKLEIQFIIDQYESGIQSYSEFTQEVGLWDSEKHVFQQYLQTDDAILDIGCGTGRTTFSLYQLGYQNIIGIDLTPGMIHEAMRLNEVFKTQIPFQIGDARTLDFPDNHFDTVIFSFNGLMSIPEYHNRKKVLEEVNRVLKDKGIFIFTTHDREKDPKFFDFWNAQKLLWQKGEQNPKLYEFGDIITTSKNESREIFIHIPNQKEVEKMFLETGFQLIETFYRDEKFEESEAVKKKSGECRFWIIQKN